MEARPLAPDSRERVSGATMGCSCSAWERTAGVIFLIAAAGSWRSIKGFGLLLRGWVLHLEKCNSSTRKRDEFVSLNKRGGKRHQGEEKGKSGIKVNRYTI